MVKAEVPTAADAAKKWADVTPGRSQYYESNTKGKGAKWQTNSTLAAGTFKASVSAGDIGTRFSGGIKRVGAPKFDRKVAGVGKDRFGPGVTAAVEDYQGGVSWVLAEEANIDMPVRKPRGDPGNNARSVAMQTGLNKKRLAMMAAGSA